jgi:hypothetical protein
MREMRKRYRVLIFAALVAALVVPVGYALSIDTTQRATHKRYVVVPAAAAAAVMAPVTIAGVDDASPASSIMVLRATDAGKLLCIGTVLFGLAAVVRKAI